MYITYRINLPYSPRWTRNTVNLRDGVAGGPLALFDRSGRVAIISPFNNFMSGVTEHETVIGGILTWGIMGSVERIPKDFVHTTAIYIGYSGINEVNSDEN